MLGQKVRDGLFRCRLVPGLFPMFDERGVRRQRGQLSRRGLRVVQIVAQQHQQRRLTAGDKVARHVEEELSIVHGLFE
jgi:hypothetical protein